MSYPYSSQSHTTVNPSTTDFSYSDVPLLADVPAKDQLKVYENGQLRTFSNNGDDNYTLNTTSELVIFNTPRSQGVTIKIARSTDIENKEVTFTNSSVLTAQDLNKNSDQLLFLCQELYDKAQDISLTATGGIPPNSIGSSQLISDAGNEAVTTSVIRDDAVTTAKILDLNVTEAKIADGAVTPVKLSTGAPSWTSGGNVTVTGDAAVDGVMSFDSGYGSTAPVYGCRAWVNFNGTSVTNVGGENRCAIRGSGNVDKVVQVSNGVFTVHFTTALTDVNYAVVGSSGTTTNFGGIQLRDEAIARTASAFTIVTLNSSGAAQNSVHINVAVFR